MIDKEMIQTFITRADEVSALVYEVATLEEAFEKSVEICKAKEALNPQIPTTGEGARPDAKRGNDRVIAAPNLDKENFHSLCRACDAVGGINLIREGLRQYPGGIDMGLTLIDFGIAETGTLVLSSNSEETRLATMLAEIHVAILNISQIRSTAIDMTDELEHLMCNTGDYTAFITGASRTADIERVLTTGVHGPLVLIIILVGE